MGESEAELNNKAPGVLIFGMVPGEECGSTKVGKTEVNYGSSRFFSQAATPEFRTNVDAEFENTRRSDIWW